MSTIRVDIEYQGTEQGAAQIGRLQENLRVADQAQQAADRSATALSATATTLGQRAGQVGGALGNTAQVLAGLNPQMRTAATVLGQMGTASGALTGAMGPLGVAIAGVTTAVGLWQIAQQRAAEQQEANREAIDRLSASYDDLYASIRRARQEQERQARLERGEGGREEFEALAQQLENRAQVLEATIRNLASNDSLTREERMLRIRTAAAQRESAMRRARAAREHIAGGEFITEVEGQGFGEGFGVDLPPAGGGRRRGGRGAQRREQSFAEAEAAAWQDAEERRAIYQDAILEGKARELEMIRQKEEIERQIHENAMERHQQEQDAIAAHYAQIREHQQEQARQSAANARAVQQEQRSLAQVGIGAAQQVASAYFEAFQVAIEGTMSLEDALLMATKQILKSIGEELVARGIGKILEGIAEIPSPTAATKIGGGTAMVAFGIGLGAAGAAIPSPQSNAEQPREQPDEGEDRGPREVTVVFGNPVLTAGTQAQLARGMGRALKGDRSLPSSVGR